MRLLVSVRGAVEAAQAVLGGADFVDVKEPANGPLGRPADDVVLEVERRLAADNSRGVALSVALGELRDWDRRRELPAADPVAYWKLGLSGMRQRAWRRELEAWQVDLRAQGFRPETLVAVAYADWNGAESPCPADVLDFACRAGLKYFLVDTFAKGVSLFGAAPLSELHHWVDAAHAAGVQVALAGSLRAADAAAVWALGADVLAVRSAATADGMRVGRVDAASVRRLKDAIASALAPRGTGGLAATTNRACGR